MRLLAVFLVMLLAGCATSTECIGLKCGLAEVRADYVSDCIKYWRSKEANCGRCTVYPAGLDKDDYCRILAERVVR